MYRFKGLVQSKEDRIKSRIAKWKKEKGVVGESFIHAQLLMDDPQAKLDEKSAGRAMMDHTMGCCTCQTTKDCPLVRAWQEQKVAIEKKMVMDKELSDARMKHHESELPDVSKLSVVENPQ